MCLHTCWQYHPYFHLIYPPSTQHYFLDHFIDKVPAYVVRAPTIVETRVTSVASCRTRGPTAYLFLLVHLTNDGLEGLPVRLKLEADAMLKAEPRLEVGTPRQSTRSLVGTWRYKVRYTVAFDYYVNGNRVTPLTLVDFLALAELANEQDPSRSGYPGIVFSALTTLFTGLMSKRSCC
ncbi:hypothetical protein B0H16DRAFT_1746601 [Mycena metata]|uniref:Uncharacterized protein n=1 Tax=Mycena metata TaxID=1033252 RepID=A0AAD7GX42_9AGAR|nr:hypothetical protein B0H16DRAFT_1746601 [Mycena metata]